MERASFTPAKPIIDVLAEHGFGHIGGMGPYQATTTLTKGKTLDEGGRFIATVAGHLPVGHVHTALGHSEAYRVAALAQERRSAA